MRIGSLCSGIGGLELGLERTGLGETVWQSEVDPHASKVLARHWPGVPNLGDLTAVDWQTVEPVDVVCAGYPCQPFSHAGKRNGTDDERHLWPAVRDAIRHLGPRLVVLENVRGHLSLGFGDVLGDLADLGFDAEWCLLRASDVGAPHQRARLFVAAYPTDVGHERDGRARRRRTGPADRGQSAADTEGAERRGTQQPAVAASAGRTSEPGERGGPDASSWGPYAAAIGRWGHIHGPAPAPTTGGRLSPRFVEWMMGYPAGWVDGLTRTAALRCLGNSVHPYVSELFGAQIAGLEGSES